MTPSPAVRPDQQSHAVTMRAMAFTGRERAEIIDWPVEPSPLGAHEVRGPTLVSLISPGTELAGYRAERTTPALSGYAAVFTVRERGAAVQDLQIGDQVFCMGAHVAEQRCLARDAVRIPAGMDPAVAVFCRLMAVSWSTLVTTTARPPDRVLVTGLGPVGNLAAQIFSAAGYAVTACDPLASRRALARSLGIADVRAGVAPEVSASEPLGGVHLAVECSGHERAVIDCCQVVAKRGEVVMVGVPWARRSDANAFEVLHAVFHRYVVLRSGWEWEVPRHAQEFSVGSMAANLAGALCWLQDGRVRVDGLARSVPVAACQEVWQELLTQRAVEPTAVFIW
jgi:NADPH:quinone reductase-like Zn-dependent oxidoreductase